MEWYCTAWKWPAFYWPDFLVLKLFCFLEKQIKLLQNTFLVIIFTIYGDFTSLTVNFKLDFRSSVWSVNYRNLNIIWNIGKFFNFQICEAHTTRIKKNGSGTEWNILQLSLGEKNTLFQIFDDLLFSGFAWNGLTKDSIAKKTLKIKAF